MPRGLGVLVLSLAVAGSLTEGIGLMLLVPMLGLLGAAGDAAGSGGRPADGSVQQVWSEAIAAGMPQSLTGLLGLFAALVALRAGLVGLRQYREQAFQLELTANLRRSLLRDVFEARWSWLVRESQGQLMAILLGTTERVAQSLQQAQMLVAAVATLAAMMAAALLIDPLPALTLGLGGVLAGGVHFVLRRRSRAEGEALERNYGEMFGFFSERLAMLRLVKSFATEGRDLALAERADAGLRRTQLAFQAGLGVGQFALQAGTAVALGVTVWLAVTRWHSTAATLLPLIAVSARSAPLLGAVQAAFLNLSRGQPALVELGRFVAAARAAGEPESSEVEPPRPRDELALDAVTVRHPGRGAAALDAVSLRLAVGSTTLLAGASGAGKSTLADVLSGLVAPDAGCLRIDGAEVAGAEARAWRGQVAYVQQEPVLLHASIRDNLLWACPGASEARIGQALRDAAAGFVFALPEGIDTVVGDRGAQLSGGERQRIALARGLLREPDLLILDEVTSALDPASEAEVVRAIGALKGRITILIISHRGALADLAERRVELAGGRVMSDRASAAEG
jgi:ATP-binding cassette subfamily C protein